MMADHLHARASVGVWYRFDGNRSKLEHSSITMLQTLDAFYGLPTGMFNGDEWLPDPPTRNPSRGIETCGVVEAMFSYTTLGAASGEWSCCSDSIPS